MTTAPKTFGMLTATLGIAAHGTEASALAQWVDKYLPTILSKTRELFAPPFNKSELKAVADVAVTAAQALKGVFSGQDRAKIAQQVFVIAVRAALPDGLVEDVVAGLLEGPEVAKMIEAAFKRLFGPNATGTPPVLDDDTLPPISVGPDDSDDGTGTGQGGVATPDPDTDGTPKP